MLRTKLYFHDTPKSMLFKNSFCVLRKVCNIFFFSVFCPSSPLIFIYSCFCTFSLRCVKYFVARGKFSFSIFMTQVYRRSGDLYITLYILSLAFFDSRYVPLTALGVKVRNDRKQDHKIVVK